MSKLNGKVAVITGAGRGIGREHALLFAREGAKVVVNDPGGATDGSSSDDSVAEQVCKEIREAGGEAVADHHAVGTSEAATAIIKTATDSFGRIDALVNNAGILRDRTILKMTDDEWNDVIQCHLTGTFTCLREAARVMKDQGTGGAIINTSSTSGLLGNFGQANYGAAKIGIHALTRIAAQEFARFQVTVNAIAPAAATRMIASVPGADMDRIAENWHPSRISPIVAFLASDAGRKVTGLTFGVEGNELFTYRMMTSHGTTRHEPSAWTLDAIESAINQIINW